MPPKAEWNTAALIAADKRYVWHPFTPMGEWCAPDHEPLVLVRGKGALLWDSKERQYIDGNSSIWTNIHGHNHPHINAAIARQLELVAHTSFLGFTNPAAVRLAEAIVGLFPARTLTRVFFSDDGSTGIEAALRIVEQFWRLRGSSRAQFIAFRDGYHGDTAGAAALGARAMFGGEGGEWRPPVRQIGSLAELTALPTAAVKQIAAVVIEPLVQGAAGMKLWPKGTLAALRAWTKGRGILLIVDEVLTGFGRTGTMFACDQESVFPDLMVLGKGLSGGYLPIALTLLSEEVFEPFSAGSSRERTFFYGHSYTGNSLACAAALASLELFSREPVLELLETKIAFLQAQAVKLRQMPWIQDVRQCGFILAIELSTPRPASIDACALAQAVCLEARRHGLLTRPIRNNIILMPPFCITKEQLRQSVTALRAAILRVCENRPEAAFV